MSIRLIKIAEKKFKAEDEDMKNGKRELQCKIEDLLRSKNTGEYHSHTFAEMVYISEHTFRKAAKNRKLQFYLQDIKWTSHSLYQIYISKNTVSISTGSYYMPVSELSLKELQNLYDTMREECREDELFQSQ